MFEAECLQVKARSFRNAFVLPVKQKQLKCLLVALCLLMLVFLWGGCSGNKEKKAITEALNRALQPESIKLFVVIGRVNSQCDDPFVEQKPINEQVNFVAAQKAGLITITPDGTDFWKVELVNPKSEIAEGLKKAKYNTKNGCNSLPFGYTVATKSVTDVANLHDIGNGITRADYKWKWALSPTGTKIVDSLTPEELAAVNGGLKTVGRKVIGHDPTFDLTNMAQSSALQAGDKLLKKSGDTWLVSTNEPANDAGSQAALGAASSGGNDTAGQPKSGEWIHSEETDQMDGHKTVSYTTYSTNSVHFTSHEGPVKFHLSCEKNVSIFVESGPVISPGIRYKFDDGAPTAIGWYILGGDAVGESASKKFIGQIMNSKTFKFEFTPMGQGPQVASYDLGNIRELIQNEKACDFQKKAK